LHVIPSVSERHGGPSQAIKAFAKASKATGIEVTVATTDDDGDHARLNVPLGNAIEQDGVPHFFFRRDLLPYKVSFGLQRWLNEHIKEFDVVHIHALFSFSSTMAARIARQNKVPYVVRPLGVLNQWGIRNRRRMPKLVSFRLVELPILLNSAAIHFTSEDERKEAALLDARLAEHESAVIPLPVEPAANGNAERFLDRYPKLRGRKIILFLSRIDRKKGLELLLDAFAIVRNQRKNVALIIAGDGEHSYVRELRERATRQQQDASAFVQGYGVTRGSKEREGRQEDEEGNEEAIIWTGHLSGEMKAAALAAADVFVLPSASENFGIAAAESMAAGVPTIVSEEVALSEDIRRYDAGVVVKRDAQQLAVAISDLLSNKEKAATLAANGRRLAEERYSPEVVGKALHDLYEEIAMNHPPFNALRTSCS
jgi:glycosyltransferase involved in cell wall biosynthesis